MRLNWIRWFNFISHVMVRIWFLNLNKIYLVKSWSRIRFYLKMIITILMLAFLKGFKVYSVISLIFVQIFPLRSLFLCNFSTNMGTTTWIQREVSSIFKKILEWYQRYLITQTLRLFWFLIAWNGFDSNKVSSLDTSQLPYFRFIYKVVKFDPWYFVNIKWRHFYLKLWISSRII